VSSASPRAITFDAAGTLLHPAEPVAQVYARLAARHGCVRDEAAIGAAFGASMRDAKALRIGDPTWRKFWAHVVATSTGCDATALVDELYDHYAAAEAWRLTGGTLDGLELMRRTGTRVGMISNWDTRLRSLLDGLGVLERLDVLVVSGEIGIEKPDPRIFEHAARELGVPIGAMVHVGDDAEDDIAGATAAGARAVHVDEARDLVAAARRVWPDLSRV
jgi:REG-2-like HAD superfamily hydrolase